MWSQRTENPMASVVAYRKLKTPPSRLNYKFLQGLGMYTEKFKAAEDIKQLKAEKEKLTNEINDIDEKYSSDVAKLKGDYDEVNEKYMGLWKAKNANADITLVYKDDTGNEIPYLSAGTNEELWADMYSLVTNPAAKTSEGYVPSQNMRVKLAEIMAHHISTRSSKSDAQKEIQKETTAALQEKQATPAERIKVLTSMIHKYIATYKTNTYVNDITVPSKFRLRRKGAPMTPQK